MRDLRKPIPGAECLFHRLREVTGYPTARLSVLIGIDGRWGAGKSGLAAWLSWQLGMPVVSLDLFVVGDTERPAWRYQDLGHVIRGRLETGRPLIVEGVCLCQALRLIDYDPDFLVWLENEGGPEHGPEEPTLDYERDFDPIGNADYRLTWRQPEPATLVG